MESHNMRVARGGIEIFNIQAARRLARRLARRAWQLWKALGGAFYLRSYSFSGSAYPVSDADRVQGRKGRPMRREWKRLEKGDRQQRAAERRLSTSRPSYPNRAEDSGLRGRESNIPASSPAASPPAASPTPFGPSLRGHPTAMTTVKRTTRRRSTSTTRRRSLTVMDIGALPRRCHSFSLTERTVCFIFEAPCLGRFRTGHDFFTCQ